MKKISRERFEWLKEQHWKLWDWLAENPGKNKCDWEGFMPLPHQRCDCFACQFVYEVGEGNTKCEHCPLGKDNIGCFGGGLFRQWLDITDWIQRNESSVFISAYKKSVTDFAKQIRDLPWNEEYVEDKIMSENYIVINGNKTELTKEQMEQLGIEIKPAKKERWRAEKGAKYYYTHLWEAYNGEVFYHVQSMIEENSMCDKAKYETKNYFKTREEAEKYARVLNTQMKLRKFADEHNTPMDWNDKIQDKYYITYCVPSSTMIICKVNTYRDAAIYFSSEELAKRATYEIGKDNIIEYLTYEW